MPQEETQSLICIPTKYSLELLPKCAGIPPLTKTDNTHNAHSHTIHKDRENKHNAHRPRQTGTVHIMRIEILYAKTETIHIQHTEIGVDIRMGKKHRHRQYTIHRYRRTHIQNTDIEIHDIRTWK